MHERDDVWFELTAELRSGCDQAGVRIASEYRGLPGHVERIEVAGVERNPNRQSDGKAGECIAALFLEQDPIPVLNNRAGDYDLIVNGAKIQVKSCPAHGDRAIWPLTRNDEFMAADFDILLLVQVISERPGMPEHYKGEQLFPASSIRGRCRGWVSKDMFRRRRRIVEEHEATATWKASTRYMEGADMHRMGIFPGFCDDPREHWCWCGEEGSRNGVLCPRHTDYLPAEIVSRRSTPEPYEGMTKVVAQAELMRLMTGYERARLWATVDWHARRERP